MSIVATSSATCQINGFMAGVPAIGANETMATAARCLTDLTARIGQYGFGRGLSAIVAAGVGMRLLLRALHGTANYHGEGYGFFFDLAANLAAGRGYQLAEGELTAFRVPGYPLFLLALTEGQWQPWLIITAQALLGGLTAIAAALIARDLFGSRAGLLAGAAAAFYPYYLWHDTALQETALVTCLTAWATLVLLRLARSGTLRLALLAGALLGAAVLTRETTLPFALLAPLWAGRHVARLRGVRRGMVAAGAILTVLGAGLTPWLVHTTNEYGEPVLGSEFGAALYAGTDPLLFSFYPDGSVDDSRAAIFARLPLAYAAQLAATDQPPLARDHLYRDWALERIAADPAGFAARSVRKVWIAFRPLPSPLHGMAENLAYVVIWVPLLLLGLAGLWSARAQWRRDLLIYAQFGAFIAITGVLWAQTAHRVFLDLYLMIYAAGFVSRWIDRRRSGPELADQALRSA